MAAAGSDQTVAIGDTVTLDGSAATDGDGDALTYGWTLLSWPAGSAAALSDPSAVNPNFVADLPGTYQVELTVDDGLAQSVPDVVTISTANTVPTAHAGFGQTVGVGQVAVLDGSLSSDPDGDELIYKWSLIARPWKSTARLRDLTRLRPRLVVDKPGKYVAQLVVNDRRARSPPSTVVITTENTPPVSDAGPDQTVLPGDEVWLDGSGSTDVDGDRLGYHWSLLFVPVGSAAVISEPSAVRPDFTADAPGSLRRPARGR